MPTVTLVYGIALAILGIAGFLGTGASHPTALIPALFGVPLVVVGLVARNPRLRMHAMHLAVLLGLLAALGSARGLAKLPALFAGTAERPAAVVLQTVMFVLSALFVGLTVRSFIAARRQRSLQGG